MQNKAERKAGTQPCHWPLLKAILGNFLVLAHSRLLITIGDSCYYNSLFTDEKNITQNQEVKFAYGHIASKWEI